MEVIESRIGKSKHKLTALPILVVLFVISFSMLTRLVIDQDRMIDAQRSLIHSLLKDNISLSKYREHPRPPKISVDRNDIEVEFEAHAAAPSQTLTTQAQSGKTQSNQVQSDQVHIDQFPSVQVLHNQAPSNQVPHNEVQSKTGSQATAKTDRKRKAVKPAVPAAPLSDPSDMRRVTFSI